MKMVTQMKEMLDTAYSESAMSQASIYYQYSEFTGGRKSAELKGRSGAPAKVEIKQTINTGATMILYNPDLIMR